jgi:hypothetical protein
MAYLIESFIEIECDPFILLFAEEITGKCGFYLYV